MLDIEDVLSGLETLKDRQGAMNNGLEWIIMRPMEVSLRTGVIFMHTTVNSHGQEVIQREV